MTETQVPIDTVAAATIPVERRHAFRRFLRRPLAVASVIWLLALMIAAATASLLPLADPLQQDLSSVFQFPSAAHPLGTDDLGRDLLSRIIFGAQLALLGAAEAVAVAVVIGLPLGVLGGYYRGWVDSLASRIADLLFSLPSIVVLLALAAVFGRSTFVSMAALGVLLSSSYIRLARASTLAVREELYVDAARAAGLRSARIMASHILPNVVGPLIVQSTLTFGSALLIQAGLGFLGLGVTPPAPDWGGMISTASRYVTLQPWLLVPSGFVLILTILAANLISDAVGEADDGGRRRPSWLRRAAAGLQGASAKRRAVAQTSDPSSETLLSVRDLVVGFGKSERDRSPVIRGISFDVHRGEILALVGESGSGKTLTALATLGLLPYPGHVIGGEIWFDGTNLVGLPESRIAALRGKRIGMISQEPMVALDPSFSVGSQLRAPLRRHRALQGRQLRIAARELLVTVGISRPDDVLRSFPHQLSGGMAQRVAIAIALAGSPELLIADEPTTALDVTVQAGILDLLRSLNRTFNMSIILVTHDLGVVADLCSRAVVMQEGLIVESADVETLFARPMHPYTRQLIAATPRLVTAGAER